MLSFTGRYKEHTVRLDALAVGRDINVVISGGDVPHIGGVAMSVYGPDLHQSERMTSTEQMLSVQGHKEAELAKDVARQLARRYSCTVAVACGIHVDGAAPEDIAGILEVVQSLVEKLKDSRSGRDFGGY
ncbi:MAG: hypothetical protein ACNI3A_18465 [Desulfovibrio sp.]|uniref:prenylated flavin chaperone LpdD n=1 Tax=Desulfovibrio sp. 7SRBS1 TaxID=3378064 RepID=UPI003B3FD906